jgi:hypothetical protein
MGGGGGSDPKERASQKALAERAAIALKRYGEVFVPLENQYIADVQNMDSPENYARVMGAASNQAQNVYEPEVALRQRDMMARGLNVNSGGFQAGSQALMEAQSRAMGQSAADAGLTQTDQKLMGMQNLVKMGQGISSEAMEGQIGLAQNRSQRLRGQLETDLGERTAIGQAVGGAAGMAAGYGLNNMQNRQNPYV